MGTRGKSLYINKETGKIVEKLSKIKNLPQCKVVELVIDVYNRLHERLNGHSCLLSDDSIILSFYLDKERRMEVYTSEKK